MSEVSKKEQFGVILRDAASERDVVSAIAFARVGTGMTQKQLSDVTGISQADISKLENGNANPSLRTLRRLAEGMGMELHIELRPAKEKI